jgi:type I restriction enzyme S subunit
VSWTETTLGKSFEIYQPQTITTKDLNENGKYLVYGANGVIGRYDKFNHDKSQLLLTCRGATCGAINVSAPYSWINGNAMVIKSKINDINIRFIEYFFRGVVNLNKAITGSAQPQITRQSLSPIIFRYPPLPIQQKIVEKLDKIFAETDKAIAATEANAKNTKALFLSYLVEVFNRSGDGWIRETIGNVCSLRSGTTVSPSLEKTNGELSAKFASLPKIVDLDMHINEDGDTLIDVIKNENIVSFFWKSQ